MNLMLGQKAIHPFKDCRWHLPNILLTNPGTISWANIKDGTKNFPLNTDGPHLCID